MEVVSGPSLIKNPNFHCSFIHACKLNRSDGGGKFKISMTILIGQNSENKTQFEKY